MNKKVKQDAATSMISTISKTISLTQGFFGGGAEKATLCMSAAIPGAAGVAASLVSVNPSQDYTPSPDDFLFACLTLATSSTFNQSGHLVVEYSVVNIMTALDQFEKLTGRSFEGRLDSQLKQSVDEARAVTATMAQNSDYSPFLPH